MFNQTTYPDHVQEKFRAYYDRVQNEVNWSMVLPKFFPKNEIRKSLRNFHTICPIHQEKTPSMRYSLTKKVYHCHGCGRGGSDIFDFIKRMNDGNRTLAMLWIRRHFGILLPFTRKEWYKIRKEIKEKERNI